MDWFIIVIAVIVWLVRAIASVVKGNQPTNPPGTPLSTRPATFGVPPEGAPYTAEQGGAPWPSPPPNAQAAVSPQQPWPQGPSGAQWPPPQVAPVTPEARWQPQAQANPEAPWMPGAGARQAPATAPNWPPSQAGAPVGAMPASAAMPAGSWNQSQDAPVPAPWAAPSLSRRDRSPGNPASLIQGALPQMPPIGEVGMGDLKIEESAVARTKPNQSNNAASIDASKEAPLSAIFKQPDSLLSAFILHEVLGPPRCRTMPQRAGVSQESQPR